ncbi:MAG: hypothetical protein N2255_09415, partial [Kiritimatiellae bacterium]|nr:hypothetical protein [Kiritimatiellia bacterium]
MPRLHIAFVAPRFPDGSVIGGGETLLRNLAEHVARSGCTVDFLTTCARDHFTWKNEVPPGCRSFGHVQVRFFPVDEHRDITTFLRIQEKICRGGNVSPAEEQAWLRNSVNSAALLGYLREHGDEYDRIITGPYLFGLTFFAAQIRPEKTILVPCLHDEPFARLHCFTDLFLSVRGVIFNSLPERELAVRLYGRHFVDSPIVGMGLDPFRADARRFATKYGIDAPYILYCGRREPMKGTPLLVDYIGAFRKRTGRDVRLVLTGVGALELPPSANLYVTDLG